MGGVAKNSIEQARAISSKGVEVAFLCPTDWTGDALPMPSVILKVLDPGPKHGQWLKPVSRILSSLKIIRNIFTLSRYISKGHYTHVMFGAYFEYLAPIWAWLLKRHARHGVVFGVMALDPVRDYVVGPLWWHRWSTAEAYSIFREVFVHKEISIDTFRSLSELRTTVVPHGTYIYPESFTSRDTMRCQLGLPVDAKVFISFGHLRDNKNLGLIFEAMIEVPEAYLLVVGTEAAPGQKTSKYYREASVKAGVDDRVRWVIRYIDDDEVHSIFTAADFALMTYSKSFRSASGIVHITAPMRIPVLVSCGDAPLGEVVEEFRLGIQIPPDSVPDITAGMRALLNNTFEGDWDRFAREYTYDKNADIVISRLFEKRTVRKLGIL